MDVESVLIGLTWVSTMVNLDRVWIQKIEYKKIQIEENKGQNMNSIWISRILEKPKKSKHELDVKFKGWC